MMSVDQEPSGGFLDELKRRRVFRVGLVYMAVGWAIIEAADTILPRLGTPDWAVTTVIFLVLAGFPLSLILAWAFDMTPEGLRRTSSASPPAGDLAQGAVLPPSSASPYRPMALGALSAVAVLTVALGIWMVRGAGEPSAAAEISQNTLAILPFSISGADELDYLREGMVELLSRNMEGMGDVTPVDPATIIQATLDDIPSGSVAAGATARRMGAGQFVTGNVSEVAGQIRIAAELYSAIGDSIHSRARSEVQGDTTQLFDLVDRLTAELLAEQTAGVASQGLNRRAALTSRSLPALKEYLIGESHLRDADFDEAVSSFRRALEIDPDFALAHYRMAVAFSFDFAFEASEKAVAEALARPDRLSIHDRGLAEALQLNLAGEWDLSESRYRALLREYPGDMEAKVMLGLHLGNMGPIEGRSTVEARRHLQEVLELDPKFLCTLCQLANLAAVEEDWQYWGEMRRRLSEKFGQEALPLPQQILLALDAGELARADSLIEEGANLEGQGAINTYHDYAHTIAQGLYDVARSERMLRIYAEQTGDGPYDAILAGEMLNVMRQGGRYADAALELAIVLDRTPPEDLEGPVLADVVLGIEPAAPLPDTLLKITRARLEEWDPRIPPDRQSLREIVPVIRLYYTGIINARLGEFTLAERQASLMESTAPTIRLSDVADAMGRSVRAAIAYYKGDMEEVVRVTDDMHPRYPSAYYNMVYQVTEGRTFQAEALFQVGRNRDALTWFEWGPTASAIDMVGLKEFRRGQIYDRLGDTDKAIEHYGKFLKVWANADPEWQFRLDEARDRIAALGGNLVTQ